MRNRMRRIGIFFLILGIVFGNKVRYASAQASPEEFLDEKAQVKITLDLQDASLRDVLKMLSVQSGLNFISSEAVAERKLTLYMDNVPLKEAMDKIFKVNNLSYELDQENRIFLVKDWGMPSLELDTRIYFLKYVRVTNSRLNQGISAAGSSAGSSASGSATSSNGLRDSLNMVISEHGKITEDPATNCIIIKDMPSKFTVIEQVIAKLDVPIPQVMVEVEILDVAKSAVDTLGIKWPQSLAQLDMTNAGRVTGFPFATSNKAFNPQGTTLTQSTTGAWTVSSWAASHFGPSIFSLVNTQLALDMLKTRDDTKFLARPKLFMLNNETAELRLSSDEAIGSLTTTQGQGTAATTTTSAERATTGVTLQVTPQISMATGEITMVISPSIKETVAGLQLGTQQTKDVEERSIKSTIRIKDGETVIIGGLIRNKKVLSTSKVAFFGDIPIIGALFRHKDTTGSKDREILVFLTPKIMNNPAQELVKANYSKASPTALPLERKQDDFSTSAPERNKVVSNALKMYE